MKTLIALFIFARLSVFASPVQYFGSDGTNNAWTSDASGFTKFPSNVVTNGSTPNFAALNLTNGLGALTWDQFAIFSYNNNLVIGNYSSEGLSVSNNGVLYGNGSGLTNLNASELASGTVSQSVLTNTTLHGVTIYGTGAESNKLTYGASGLTMTNNNGTFVSMANGGVTGNGSLNFTNASVVGGVAMTNGVINCPIASGSAALRLTSGSYIQYGNGYDCRLRLNGTGSAEYQTVEITRFAGKSGIAVSTSPGAVTDDSVIATPSAGNWIIGGAIGSGTPNYCGSLTTSNLFLVGTLTATNGYIYPPKSSGPTWAQVGISNTIVMWSSNNIPPTLFGSYFDATSNRVDKVLLSFP